MAHSLDIDVMPLVDWRLRAILGSDDVQWLDGRVHVAGVDGRLHSKEVRRALESFVQATAPNIAMREAMKRALLKDAALPL